MSDEARNLGDFLQASGRFDEAIAAYQQAIVRDPDVSWNYHSLGDVLLKLERWDEAVATYQQAVKLNPNFSWSYHNLGDALLKLQRWEEAVAAYRCEIALKSDFAWSFYNLGDALTQLNQPDAAIIAYLQAVQIDRDLPGIYPKLGFVIEQTPSNLRFVLAAANLPVTRNNLDFYWQLGKNLARFDRPQTAIIFYNLLLTLEQENEIILYELEWLCKQEEKRSRTLASARAKVVEKPDDCWSYYNLGAVLSQQKYTAEAAEAFWQAIKIEPDIPWWFYYNLWEVAIEQNQLDAIENLYRQVVAKKPDAFWPYLNLGETLTRQGKIAEAISCYQTVSYNQTLPSLIEKSVGKMSDPHNWDLKPVTSPHFIIIGSQRCGTTSLYSYLSQHPQILTPIKKEMDFFSWHFHRGIDWYLAHFPQLPESRQFITGEASPSYFDCRETPQRLHAQFPQVKLILLLRNPVDRAISHFHRLVELNWESRGFDRAISDEFERLNRNPEYIIGEEPGNYLARGRYLEFIKNWLALFPREQLLVLQSEDLYAGAAETVDRVLEFLNLPKYRLSEYQNANPGIYLPASESVRCCLRDYFQPYNQQLEEYLGMKFNWQ
ncbi:MAG: tetratricopeptide repeat protein [Microcoleus sp.]